MRRGLACSAGYSINFPRPGRDRLEFLFVVAIVLLAFGLRFFALTDIPADVFGDEASVGNAARRILSGADSNLFGLGLSNPPELSFAWSAVSLQLFGDNLFGLRMASVIEGTLSVPLLYGVTKHLFSTRIAAMAALFLATSTYV